MGFDRLGRDGTVKGTKRFAQVTPGSSPTELAGINNRRVTISLANIGKGTAWLVGSTSHTINDGYPLYPKSERTDGDSLDAWYAIGDSDGVAKIAIVEVSGGR